MARVRLSSNINALQLAFARCAKMGCPIILMIFKELHGTAENGSEACRDMKNPAYSQLGAVGNLKAARSRSQNAIARRPAAQGRQAGAAPATRSRAGSKSADDDGDGGGDPEPPEERLYTYAEFAQLFRVACQTLRNKVSAGQFPAPVHTIFGPRFNQQHVDYAVNPPKETDSSPPRRRGRPRIAGSKGGRV